ncbi:hypothetical protein [Sphingomonas sp. PAMC 26605]|nr:hypothetical protein [Sphingomonas sp. PAMC 26605]
MCLRVCRRIAREGITQQTARFEIPLAERWSVRIERMLLTGPPGIGKLN